MTHGSDLPLGRLLYETAQSLKKVAEKYLDPFGLTGEQMHLLKNLSPDYGMTQKALGGLVNKTPANLTRILDRLENKMLIERRSDSDDRRAYLVFLTMRGRNLVSDVDMHFQAFSTQLLRGISEETQNIVRECLQSMSANLDQMSLALKKHAD